MAFSLILILLISVVKAIVKSVKKRVFNQSVDSTKKKANTFLRILGEHYKGIILTVFVSVYLIITILMCLTLDTYKAKIENGWESEEKIFETSFKQKYSGWDLDLYVTVFSTKRDILPWHYTKEFFGGYLWNELNEKSLIHGSLYCNLNKGEDDIEEYQLLQITGEVVNYLDNYRKINPASMFANRDVKIDICASGNTESEEVNISYIKNKNANYSVIQRIPQSSQELQLYKLEFFTDCEGLNLGSGSERIDESGYLQEHYFHEFKNIKYLYIDYLSPYRDNKLISMIKEDIPSDCEFYVGYGREKQKV